MKPLNKEVEGDVHSGSCEMVGAGPAHHCLSPKQPITAQPEEEAKSRSGRKQKVQPECQALGLSKRRGYKIERERVGNVGTGRMRNRWEV